VKVAKLMRNKRPARSPHLRHEVNCLSRYGRAT
jgi:hypothetical protein